jgi:hypothetical protein
LKLLPLFVLVVWTVCTKIMFNSSSKAMELTRPNWLALQLRMPKSAESMSFWWTQPDACRTMDRWWLRWAR